MSMAFLTKFVLFSSDWNLSVVQHGFFRSCATTASSGKSDSKKNAEHCKRPDFGNKHLEYFMVCSLSNAYLISSKIGSFSQLFRDSNRSFGRGGGLNDSSFDDLPRAKITQEQVGMILLMDLSKYVAKAILFSDANSLCSICFDGFAVDIDVLKLECNHLFHIECIRQWLRLHSNCPVCRSNVGSVS